MRLLVVKLPNEVNPMQIIGLIVLGLLVGIVAKLLMPGRDPGGFIITILLGIAGSFIGAYIASLLRIGGTGWLASFAMAVIGAMLLLLLYRLIRGATTTA
jgi:uncharacterized membrane protein YeaQ/YmgE (transglycosylase-associated protein family)